MTEEDEPSRRRVRVRALADLGSRVVEGLLLNVGDSGGWLALPTSLDTGRPIKITFEHPDHRGTVNASGVVTHCVRLGIPETPPFGLGGDFDRPLSGVLAERAPRAPAERVPLMLSGADGVPERGVLVNVSGTGLLVVVRRARRKNEEVSLHLDPPEDSGCPAARLSACVQWVQEGDPSGFVATGMQVTDFPTLTDREAFATWVAERLSRRT